MLFENTKGHYQFLKGIEPYSCGAIAANGFEVVHATLAEPLPWREGFDRVDRHLRASDRGRHALCGVELRCPKPHSMDGFIGFNEAYCELLASWDLHVDGLNPVARTNVAPLYNPPDDTTMHGFSYTMPCREENGRTFVIAGAGELLEGELVRDGIVRRGETGPDAMREKAAYVVRVMADRLAGVGAPWSEVTTVDVYTVHRLDRLLEQVVAPGVGWAQRHGFRWYLARPPVIGIEFEMDVRGVRREIRI
ncbi:MAG: RidA family protein [Gemmatimonadota bacterium]|nr:RidA family protein [Gemmatimonadota bacterium]